MRQGAGILHQLWILCVIILFFTMGCAQHPSSTPVIIPSDSARLEVGSVLGDSRSILTSWYVSTSSKMVGEYLLTEGA